MSDLINKLRHGTMTLDLRYKAAKRIEELENHTCQWTYVDDPFGDDVWESACGETWCFVEGDLKDNRVRYCQGCGGKIEELKGEGDG